MVIKVVLRTNPFMITPESLHSRKVEQNQSYHDQNLTHFYGRCCWRDGTASWSIQLYDVDVRFIIHSICLQPILQPYNSIGRIIGTSIFSTPSSILSSVHSVGASLMLWVLGFVLSFCGLFVWLEFGTMFPRSGGEKVYLEAVYKKPRFLATVIFAINAILLGFTAAPCIVSFCSPIHCE